MLAKNIFKTFESDDFKTIEMDEFSYYLPVGGPGGGEYSTDPDTRPTTKNGIKIASSEDFSAETNQERALRRAKKAVKQLVLNNVTREWKFVTLTYAGEGQHDPKELKRDIKEMIRRLEHWCDRDVPYIGTVEEHESDHGLHVHLVMRIPYIHNDAFAERMWQKGFTKIEALDLKDRKGGIVGIVSYLVKYMMKNAEINSEYQHSYLRSRDLREEIDIKYADWTEDETEAYVKKILAGGFVEVKDFTVEISPGFTMRRRIFVFRKIKTHTFDKILDTFRGKEIG